MSLGISPTAGSSFPSPPLAVGSLPRNGGILLNKSDDGLGIRRPSEPTSPTFLFPDPSGGPTSPAVEKGLSLVIPEHSPSLQSGPSKDGSASQRIRFAPLPDPTRPRSLSTGQDPHWAGGDEQGSHQTVVVTDVRGYDNALESEDEDEDDEERHKRGRRWSKSMSKGIGMGGVDWGSGWKGTKKILTMGLIGDEEEGYANGAPLKKSVSTGGFIGSSPFRWTAETDRKKNMLGTSPSSGPSLLPPSRDSSTHRRGSSLETSGQLGASPVAKPVKMLNGRVYGGRRASEATLAEKKAREKNEPEFVEWGHGKGGGGMGSNQPARGFLDDEDDGSGMAWARKRRQRREQEEKERKEREARESEGEAGSALETDHGGESDSSQKATPMPITPAVPSSDLPVPPPPIIQVSEHLTPYDSAPAQIQTGPSDHGAENKPSTPIGIMAGQRRQERDVFDESGDEDANKRGSDSSDEEEEDDEEEEEDDEGDFSDDDEEEEEFRTTSTAAGVEKISRHREQSQAPPSQLTPAPAALSA